MTTQEQRDRDLAVIMFTLAALNIATSDLADPVQQQIAEAIYAKIEPALSGETKRVTL